jgi:hypothetical protein
MLSANFILAPCKSLFRLCTCSLSTVPYAAIFLVIYASCWLLPSQVGIKEDLQLIVGVGPGCVIDVKH